MALYQHTDDVNRSHANPKQDNHGQSLIHIKTHNSTLLYYRFFKISYEDVEMGCCGSCGGEAPNHTNEQDKGKEKETESTNQSQEQGQKQAQKQETDKK